MSLAHRAIQKIEPVPVPFDETAGYILRSANKTFARALQQRIEPLGVTMGMWYFLRTLWLEDGLTQRELSQRVEMMEPTTATALRAMEQRGLVRRIRNVDDKRKVNIYLTEEGRALRDVLLPEAHAVDAASLRGVSHHDIEIFAGVLATIREKLSTSGGA